MKTAKLSLVAIIATVGFSSHMYGADTLAEAFANGKFNGELKAWYWDKTEDNANGNYNLTNFAIELGYMTAPFYGFSAKATFQGNASPFAEDDAKVGYVNEEYASGAVLSEIYLAYSIGKTNIKVGRQYINTPLISGNYARIFKESFEGVSISNTDVPDTTIFANYIQKFQGRTSNISGDGIGDAPTFNKRIVLGGVSALAYEFEDAYALGVINKSIPNLTLTAQYLQITDVVMGSLKDDISLYYTEANYVLPMNSFKLGFDVNYRGSRTGNHLDARNYEGDMLGLRASVLELNGFGAAFAFTTVSNNDAVVMGLGNGPSSYTGLPIRGPYAYSCFAGMDSYSLELFYNFAKVGISGLQAMAQYINANQDAPSATAGSTAAHTHADYEGYAGSLTYAIPAIKGLTTQLLYVTLEREATNAAKVKTTTDTDELWVKINYKF